MNCAMIGRRVSVYGLRVFPTTNVEPSLGYRQEASIGRRIRSCLGVTIMEILTIAIVLQWLKFPL